MTAKWCRTLNKITNKKTAEPPLKRTTLLSNLNPILFQRYILSQLLRIYHMISIIDPYHKYMLLQ